MTHRSLISGFFVIAAVALGSAACGGGQEPQAREARGAEPKKDRAVAVVVPTQGNQAAGVVNFTKTEEGLRLHATFEGLSPGRHGFHIHESGDCSAADASSAGAHFNPSGESHGRPGSGSHAGDLGNVVADDQGRATLDVIIPDLALEGENAVVGRSIIVHAQPDDLRTQPTGGSGARLACGVIATPDML